MIIITMMTMIIITEEKGTKIGIRTETGTTERDINEICGKNSYNVGYSAGKIQKNDESYININFSFSHIVNNI